MSILYEILIATLFSALLSPQPQEKKLEAEKVTTEQVSNHSKIDCKTAKNAS